MKELSTEQKAQRYNEALERAKGVIEQNPLMEYLKKGIEYIFPELKESEDDNIRRWIINEIKIKHHNLDEDNVDFVDKAIAWLEKQVPVDEDEIVKGIRRGVAISLMNHIDANSKGMCLSNMECEDIENAIVNEDWDKVYGYMKKKLEKQGEQKPADWSADDLPEFESYLCLMFQKFRTKGICTNGEIIDYVNEHSQKLKDILCHAWSEEDNKNLEKTVWYVEEGGKLIFQKTDKLMSWLKSLKDRYTWKPTMEQLTVLSNAIELRPLYESDGIILMSLYYDLKKLTE